MKHTPTAEELDFAIADVLEKVGPAFLFIEVWYGEQEAELLTPLTTLNF